MRLIPSLRVVVCLAVLLPTVSAAGPGDLDTTAVGLPEGNWFFADGDGTLVTVEHLADGSVRLDGSLSARLTGELALKTLDDAAVRVIEGWDEVDAVVVERPGRGLYRVVAADGVDPVGLSTRIVGLPGVVFCHPDLILATHPHGPLDDPRLDDAWHLDNQGQGGGLPGVDVGAYRAWQTATGAGQVIAIIDSGVDMEHPDLDVLPGYDFGGNDEDPSPDPTFESHGHGTAMAGVAAAIGDNGEGSAGVAPDAQVLPIKFVGDADATLFDIHDAFVYAVDEGAGVLSNSWGFSAQGCAEVPLPGLIIEALEYVETEGRDGRGAAFAMSYGNGGCDASADQWHEYETIITVGASTDLDRKVGYSNYGSGADIMGFGGGDGRPGLVTTDVTGEGGYTDGAYWDGGSGTSSACASVAGVLALAFESNPRLTASQAREALCETATRPSWEDTAWDDTGWSSNYGCGRADADALVAAVADLGPPVVTAEDPGTPHPEQVVLRWTVDDPDDNGRQVTLTLTPAGGGEGLVYEVTDATELDVSADVGPETSWAWTVQGADRWGPGEVVEGPGFTVGAIPEEGGGCSSVPGHAGWPLVLLGLLWRRRRGPRSALP